MQAVYCLYRPIQKPVGAALQQQEEDATLSPKTASFAHTLRCIRIRSKTLNTVLGLKRTTQVCPLLVKPTRDTHHMHTKVWTSKAVAALTICTPPSCP